MESYIPQEYPSSDTCSNGSSLIPFPKYDDTYTKFVGENIAQLSKLFNSTVHLTKLYSIDNIGNAEPAYLQNQKCSGIYNALLGILLLYIVLNTYTSGTL